MHLAVKSAAIRKICCKQHYMEMGARECNQILETIKLEVLRNERVKWGNNNCTFENNNCNQSKQENHFAGHYGKMHVLLSKVHINSCISSTHEWIWRSDTVWIVIQGVEHQWAKMGRWRKCCWMERKRERGKETATRGKQRQRGEKKKGKRWRVGVHSGGTLFPESLGKKSQRSRKIGCVKSVCVCPCNWIVCLWLVHLSPINSRPQ